MTLGERIKAARKEKGITQKELADLINKGFSTVQKYEIDVIEPPISVLEKIAKALEIDPKAMEKISKNDKKRILRVLEIYKATGKTKTEQEMESRKNPVEYDYKVFAINWEREKLYQRINTVSYTHLTLPTTSRV